MNCDLIDTKDFRVIVMPVKRAVRMVKKNNIRVKLTFLVMIVILGTVASANANNSLAPCRMMPPYSCAVPGRKPGTSTKVTKGMLNASQNLTNLAAFTDELMSKQPVENNSSLG